MGVKTISAESNMLPDAVTSGPLLEDFQSTFWLFDNLTTPVLQYFQNVNFLFGLKDGRGEPCFGDRPASECLLSWPHTQLSTLVKVRSIACEDR